MVFHAIWWMLFSCPLVYSRTSARDWSEWMAVSCLRCPCDSFGFHSVWLRPVNYCVLSTPNTEGAMDENPSCCDCVSLFACVCRYSSLRAGGWFYIYVVQCLLISQWAICLIFSSSLFTQRDSQPTAFPLPLATLRMLACTLVYVRVWLSVRLRFTMFDTTCVVQVFQKICVTELMLSSPP